MRPGQAKGPYVGKESGSSVPVTVADTDSIDMHISGQEISGDTKGLTDTKVFTTN
jgi:hypothetical protein